ncbi:MAG: chemotaxis protein, partial [Arcobacter sp.]
MLKNLSTKMKLLLFPLMFIVIVIICATIYVNKSNFADKRNEIAIKTEVLIQELLKGRIAVYQYMRNPSDETALKVKDTFKSLDSEVTALKNILVIEKNRVLCDEILSSSKQYISDFESYSSKYTKNPQETPELKEIISNMVKAGGVLESKIKEINNTAIESRIAAYESLNTILSIVAIVAILIFILISLFISKIVANSLDNFKSGLISFFSYLNRSSNQISLLDDTVKDEFGEMAKFVNDNIKQIEKTINQDNLLIDDAKVVMSRVNNGWYGQFIEKSTSNTSLEEFKNN